MADPGVYTSGVDIDETMKAHAASVRRVSELESEWERLTEGLEAV